MIRTSFLKLQLCLLALVLFAFPAMGQVAVSDHSVGVPRISFYKYSGFNSTSFTADNPAAISWVSTTQMGLGALNHSVLDEEPNVVPPAVAPPEKKVTATGTYFGGRIVGESGGVAGGYVELNRTETNYLFQERNSELQVSFKMNDLLSFGAGGGSITRTNKFYNTEPGTPEFTGQQLNLTRRTLGVSMRLGEVFYLGVAGHRDTAESIDVYSGTKETGERAVSLGGIAIRTEGKMRWFLGIDQLQFKEFNFAKTPVYTATNEPVHDPNEFKVLNVTLQGRDDVILLGFSQQNLTTLNKDDKIVAQSMNFGYKPYDTFVFGVTGTVTTHENTVTPVKITYTNLGFSLGTEF